MKNTFFFSHAFRIGFAIMYRDISFENTGGGSCEIFGRLGGVSPLRASRPRPRAVVMEILIGERKCVLLSRRGLWRKCGPGIGAECDESAWGLRRVRMLSALDYSAGLLLEKMALEDGS